MTLDLFLRNLLLWTAQTTVLLAIAAAIARLLKSAPAPRLALWQLALAACLLLPAIGPMQQEVLTEIPLTHLTHPIHVVAVHTVTAFHWPSPWESLALLLAAGAAFRFALLALGLFRLRRYRRDARPFIQRSFGNIEAELLISRDVPGPVTFGFMNPVVLLPNQFATLDIALRDTILYHEILHVRRKDWLFAVAEETLRAALWFHPAVWYAIREIQLAREEVVDREVVDTMNAREAYVDALLAIAGAPLGRELAPAPFFIRRKHLKRRVISIFREVKMSKRTSVSALLAGCAALTLSAWLITGALPLKAQPQTIYDGPGVTVDTGGAHLKHRSSIGYPADLLAKRTEGTVAAQVRLDSTGSVLDATILSGPDELRKTVLESVLNWHFTSDAANSTRQVIVNFAVPAFMPAEPITTPTTATRGPVLKSITVRGLSDAERTELTAKLPVHEGDTLTPELSSSVLATVKSYDEHLIVATMFRGPEGASLDVRLPPGTSASVEPQPAAVPGVAPSPGPIRIGPMVAAANLVNQVKPQYPALAKQARVQGTVTFEATIATDGTVQNLHLLSGPPLLIQAAMQAVQQWVYKPTRLNGQPVQVITNIDVNFTLAE